MTPLLVLVASLPCLYWTQAIESRPALEAAGIRRLCVPPDQIDAWRSAGFEVRAVAEAELASRISLPTPGVTARAGLASPTRSPWIVANGWRFVRSPDARYVFDVTPDKAALALAEAFAYGADAVVKVDSADEAGLRSIGSLLSFLGSLPDNTLPAVADLGVVDDGSAQTGEVMNLLARRNLLYEAVQAPSERFRINIALGSPGYPRDEAADPSAFALKIRRQLTDERRSLRVFGSEVVIGRLTGDGRAMRLHLLNYGGREIEGLRIRLRGSYGEGEAHVAGEGRLALVDHVVADGATEFSLPRLTSYAVVDLKVR